MWESPQVHAEKLRERHWGSCGSLASLSTAGDDVAGVSPSSSFTSAREMPASLLFRQASAGPARHACFAHVPDHARPA